MSDAGSPRLEGKQKSMCNSTLCALLFLACFCSSSRSCPDLCVCHTTVVNCGSRELGSVPQLLPDDTTVLNISGNHIKTLDEASFPKRLEHLTQLYVSGSRVEQLDAAVFHNLPNLGVLDLSNNSISQFHTAAFPKSNKIEILNLSGSLYNHSYIGVLADLLNTSLPMVQRLDLSSNDLVVVPEDMFAGLMALGVLDLRNNSIVSIKNGTFQNPALKELDLRDNALKRLSNGSVADLSSIPGLRLRLSGNPWRCDCTIEDMLVWLRRQDVVDDGVNLTCFDPAGLRNVSLLHLDPSEVSCVFSGDLKGVLETSYVFLGMVLAMVGVVFLVVLYLNRKGMKKWIYNIRDACRDHMEGYHYRYEVNTDPQLANLSLNSDV